MDIYHSSNQCMRCPFVFIFFCLGLRSTIHPSIHSVQAGHAKGVYKHSATHLCPSIASGQLHWVFITLHTTWQIETLARQTCAGWPLMNSDFVFGGGNDGLSVVGSFAHSFLRQTMQCNQKMMARSTSTDHQSQIPFIARSSTGPCLRHLRPHLPAEGVFARRIICELNG